jgi:cobalt-zinc-cadmium resistance protein CzcA
VLEREITNRLDQRVPGIAISLTQPMQMRLDELISGVRADLAVKIFGDNADETRAVAEQIARVINRSKGPTKLPSSKQLAKVISTCAWTKRRWRVLEFQ